MLESHRERAAKLLPYGFGTATGSSFLVEDAGDLSEDEELCDDKDEYDELLALRVKVVGDEAQRMEDEMNAVTRRAEYDAKYASEWAYRIDWRRELQWQVINDMWEYAARLKDILDKESTKTDDDDGFHINKLMEEEEDS